MVAVFAHRGVTGVAGASPALRENTLDAFAKARRLGADGVELDVRLCAGGVPVVHHDERLATGERLADLGVADLPAWLPTLAAALDACRGMSVNVELKHDEADPARQLARVVAALVAGRRHTASSSGAPPGWVLSSFDAESLAVARGVAPQVPTGLLVDWRSDPVRALGEARELGCASVHPFVTQVDARLVGRSAAAGLGLHVWTVNADADLVRMGELGVVAVITDRVGAAVNILRAGAASNGGPVGG